ncbi:hypothetical protein PTTG_05862 [Puccinia triticina 1-1 BBBD Race 1]|uniref:NUC153 domain-containing protein n=2 Tax=Puccinia triticina TaxID=208348 RepID=A0A0C4EYG2_PUCT1|nr:hypothetical protein PTTG_05862 [Puccinia triticina 1-1 BBBD Race 1]
MPPFTSNTHQAKIYTVNGGVAPGQNQPDWLGSTITRAHRERAKKKKKKAVGPGTEGKSLIQDLDFPEASNKVKSTSDGKFLIATGTYKPRMKVYELDELALKFDRVTDSENVDFCILSTDWTKTLHLQTDRTLDLHTQTASYYRVRIPRHGRALAYHFPSCDALCGGAGSELWRLNLEQGRFMAPFQLSSNVTGINAIDVNPVHGLVGLGTETDDGKGTVEFWDHRARAPAGILKLPFAKLSGVGGSWDDSCMSVSVSALASRLDGLTVAVGTSTGHTLLYDLRAPLAHTIKDQGYGLPIKKIEWPTSVAASGFGQTEGLVATADSKVVKIWSRHTTDNLISVNPLAPINDMHIYPDSGLVFLANEASPMTGYFIPSLGPAPRWCRFLENMTEEMEDSKEVAIYDDYKFVSDSELASLSLDHLVGTPALRPYMHGYFIDLRLYAKAKAIANPFAYVEHRDKLVKERIQKEQESRIRTSKLKTKSNESKSMVAQNVKINKDLAEKLIEQEQTSIPMKTHSKKNKAKNIPSGSLLTDERFGDLFTNEDFEIDKYSREYAAINPSSAATARNQVIEPKEDEYSNSNSEESQPENVGESESEDSSEDDDVWKKRDRRQMGELKKHAVQERNRSGRGGDRSEETSTPLQPYQSKPRMYINTDKDHDPTQIIGDLDTREKTFGQKLINKKGRPNEAGQSSTESAASKNETLRSLGGGSMEFSFNPSPSNTTANSSTKKSVQQRPKAAENFGIGLSKGSIARDQEENFIQSLDQDNLSGRTRKRKIERSASKTKIRKL